jgi:hypothetical protein
VRGGQRRSGLHARDADGVEQVDAVVVLEAVVAARRHGVHVVDVDEALLQHRQPGLLVHLADDGVVRGLAVVDTAARQRPPARRVAGRGDAGEQQPGRAGLVVGDDDAVRAEPLRAARLAVLVHRAPFGALH